MKRGFLLRVKPLVLVFPFNKYILGQIPDYRAVRMLGSGEIVAEALGL